MVITALIVEDVEEIRALIRLNLELDGRFEVIGEAADADEAILVATSRQPDVIITDLAMPSRSGLDAIANIRRTCPDARIIVFSGFARTHYLAAVTAGADLCLEKTIASFHDLVTHAAELAELDGVA